MQQFDLTNIGVTIGLPFFKSTLGFLDVPKILRRKELHSYIKDKIELQLKDNLDDYAYDYGVLNQTFFTNNRLKTVVFCLSKQETPLWQDSCHC